MEDILRQASVVLCFFTESWTEQNPVTSSDAKTHVGYSPTLWRPRLPLYTMYILLASAMFSSLVDFVD
jgi:hypothetical protein